MYTDNSENLIPGVNQFPHTHSAETETHIPFIMNNKPPSLQVPERAPTIFD